MKFKVKKFWNIKCLHHCNSVFCQRLHLSINVFNHNYILTTFFVVQINSPWKVKNICMVIIIHLYPQIDIKNNAITERNASQFAEGIE